MPSQPTEVSLNRSGRVAAFVRGYFLRLESLGIQAALLHGWEGEFEGRISDVDYVIAADAFQFIAWRVHEYCESSGWRLCQVLRHEDTAAFCVCSAVDDPSCVVALDACSDYQRNGLVFLTAGELLEDRRKLEWGGFRLSPQMELRYRFIKAVAKAKRHQDVIPEILALDEAYRLGFSEFLRDSWNVLLDGWSPRSIATAMDDLARHCGPQTTRYRLSAIPRIARRIKHPDGLLVILPAPDEERAQALIAVFSGLYFRRHLVVRHAGVKQRLDLIRSTLVMAQTADSGVMIGLGRECVISLPAPESPEHSVERIATHLNQRCLKRMDCLKADFPSRG